MSVATGWGDLNHGAFGNLMEIVRAGDGEDECPHVYDSSYEGGKIGAELNAWGRKRNLAPGWFLSMGDALTNFGKWSHGRLLVRLSKRDSPWKERDQRLYDMCKDWPGQRNKKQVIAKLNLILKSYSAGIERIGKNGSTADSEKLYGRLAASLRTKQVERELSGLRKQEILGYHNVETILRVHQLVTKAFRAAAGLKKNPRSAASKYLHFHAPGCVPIFDQTAVRELGAISRDFGLPDPDTFRDPRDEKYRDFCYRYLAVNHRLAALGSHLSPRDFDWALFGLARQRKK